MSFIPPLCPVFPPEICFSNFFFKLDYSSNNDPIFMKKIGEIDFGFFYNAAYLFKKINYSLRDIGKIMFLSGVTLLSPTHTF
jgi:hypothetical protein